MFAMGPRRTLQVLISLLVAPAVAAHGQQTSGDAKPIERREPTRFIRVQRDEFREPLSLQTATVKYVLRNDRGEVRAEAFLESVIHIGDAAYYRGFNRRFPHYDAVLYELIAKPDQRVPDTESGNSHPAKLLQDLISDSLGFEHQIDRIDYQAKNMVHADLSPQQMAAARQQRGDDEVTMLAQWLVDLLRQTGDRAPYAQGVTPFDLASLSDPDGTIELRRMLARTLDESGSTASLLPPTLLRSLIGDRNRHAMEVFDEQLDQGARRIAFFWGAAHMPDLEKRLVLEYGFQPESTHWRSAWDLRKGSLEQAPLDSAIERTIRSLVDGALDEFFQQPKR